MNQEQTQAVQFMNGLINAAGADEGSGGMLDLAIKHLIHDMADQALEMNPESITAEGIRELTKDQLTRLFDDAKEAAYKQLANIEINVQTHVTVKFD